MSFSFLFFPEPITFKVIYVEQNLTEGKSDTVRCEVGGDPAPTIIWQFKGKDLSIVGNIIQKKKKKIILSKDKYSLVYKELQYIFIKLFKSL